MLEMLALLTVVASLIAIVVELRQTQNALEATAYQERGFRAIEDLQAQLLDEELIEFFLRMESFQSIEELSDIDQSRVLTHLRMIRVEFDNDHYQYEKGFLDPEFYFGQTVPGIKRNAPFWRDLLSASEPRASFKEEVDRILSED